MRDFFSYLLISGTLCLIITCTDSKDDIVTNEALIFGRYYGFCGSSCFEVYQLTKDALSKDDSVERYTEQYRYSATTTLDNAAYESAKALLSNIPSYLLSKSEDQVLGCPDCADQGGVYLMINNDDQLIWHFDTSDTNDQSSEIKAFKKEVVDVIEQLQL